jgi:hypothetical protein
MPRYYFHLASRDGYERDEVGSDLPDVHEAYLEAFETAQQLSVDLIRQNARPAHYRFEICDDRNRVVMELPFGEILGSRGGPQEITEAAARGRSLVQDVHAEIAKGRAELIALRAALSRI